MGLFSSIEELGKKVKEGNIFHDLGKFETFASSYLVAISGFLNLHDY